MIETLWQQFYNNVKDTSWPDCPTEQDFDQLPDHIKQEILVQHNGGKYLTRSNQKSNTDLLHYNPILETENDQNQDYLYQVDFEPECAKTFDANGICVHYDAYMDYGGKDFGQNYSRVIQHIHPGRKFNHCLEWCAGSGAVGFRLLADDVCTYLDLADIYQPSLSACKKTIANLDKKYQGRATTHHIQYLESIPQNCTYDLIVGIPPWFSRRVFGSSGYETRRGIDTNWQIHNNFFSNVGKYLDPNGSILLLENPWGSGPDDFAEIIDKSGLKIVQCFMEQQERNYYYLEVKHQ